MNKFPAFTAAREEQLAITNFGDLRYTGWGGGVPLVVAGEGGGCGGRQRLAGGGGRRPGRAGGGGAKGELG